MLADMWLVHPIMLKKNVLYAWAGSWDLNADQISDILIFRQMKNPEQNILVLLHPTMPQ
jgi:hypothetical protein